MASIIKSDNGVSSGITGIVQSADSSGQLVLQTTTSGGTATTAVTIDNTQVATFVNTLKAPNLQGPTFSYYNASTQTVATATFTKILFATSEWDTTSGMYASSRFTPTVAGYYLITGALAIYNMGATGYAVSYMYKNGSGYRIGNVSYASATQEPQLIFSSTVYLNGSTDYIEIYCYQNTGVTATIDAGKQYTFFQGSLIRSA